MALRRLLASSWEYPIAIRRHISICQKDTFSTFSRWTSSAKEAVVLAGLAALLADQARVAGFTQCKTVKSGFKN